MTIAAASTLLVRILACVGTFLAAVAAAPAGATPAENARIARYEGELQSLASALKLPGIAYVIVQDGVPIASRGFGVSQADRATPFTTATPLRIASVTKALTATIALQLAEEGKLDLAAPASRYADQASLPAQVQVQHLLTHTSEGRLGSEYVYGTSRYAKLAPILANASGLSFEQLMRERIVERAGMQWHASPDLGAQGGLVSTVDDMARLLSALDRGLLASQPSMARLATPSEFHAGRPLPVSLGWFAQTVQGERLMWSFGQDDEDHSGALLLRLPDRKLSLFILANANMISDPFRLLMGDVRKSPFAMSFLRLFAFSPAGEILPAIPADEADLGAWLDRQEASTSYRYGDELLAQAMLDAWLRRTDVFAAKLKLADRRYGWPNGPDPVVHFAAMQLGWEDPDHQAVKWGRSLLDTHPDNRWILLSQGYLLQRAGAEAEAARCFEHILALPNQEPDYLALLFKGWSWSALAQMVRDEDPARAREYLKLVLDSGVGDPIEDNAEKAMAELGG
jgi:CubicO group peptidase (beta-lactamase class C family)